MVFSYISHTVKNSLVSKSPIIKRVNYLSKPIQIKIINKNLILKRMKIKWEKKKTIKNSLGCSCCVSESTHCCCSFLFRFCFPLSVFTHWVISKSKSKSPWHGLWSKNRVSDFSSPTKYFLCLFYQPLPVKSIIHFHPHLTSCSYSSS